MHEPDPVHLERLHRTFHDAFGAPAPRLLVRAPGRVNIIGDHVDYVGLPVLPIAMARASWMLVRPRSDEVVRVADCDDAFGHREFALAREVPPWPAGDWGNYLKAGAQAMWGELGPLTGFDAAHCSTVPPASGLSSSSALVIAATLALLAANERAIGPTDLAELLARGERYVGTQGGGMDQAIILGARASSAARISFDPLRLEHVRVPADWRFVVAHSLVVSQKAGAGRKEYNRRPREAQEALLALTPWLEPPGVQWTYDRLLRSIDPGRLLTLGSDHLSETLGRRFRHVVTEALRVDAAVEALQSNCAETLGELMLESHRSLRDDMQVSVPALNELVDAGMAAGALGGRLTGAGQGGSVVFLSDEAGVRSLCDSLRERFYAPRGHADGVDRLCFAVSPSEGASVGALA